MTRKVTVHPKPWKANLVLWQHGLALPERFSAEIDDPHLPFSTTIECEVMDGRPVCTGLVLHQKSDGPPLTARLLRAGRLSTYVGAAAAAVALRIDGQSGNGTVVDRSMIEPKRIGRRLLTEEHLGEVVAVYTEARAQHRSSTRAVSSAYGVSAGTVARWVRESRKRELL